jgi:hypothetical protein
MTFYISPARKQVITSVVPVYIRTSGGMVVKTLVRSNLALYGRKETPSYFDFS